MLFAAIHPSAPVAIMRAACQPAACWYHSRAISPEKIGKASQAHCMTALSTYLLGLDGWLCQGCCEASCQVSVQPHRTHLQQSMIWQLPEVWRHGLQTGAHA